MIKNGILTDNQGAIHRQINYIILVNFQIKISNANSNIYIIILNNYNN